ncbi:hypothetical protein UFOVP460_13 [uncultured Caudovirales phage]|uniref:Uncharacterized protein n=1 Tax=uncultured Caudovirales phage TaxID=2100421 RepID=A0A6J5MKE4_9CAUD|nr:hypothetical protein UFOVP460_13 [uncultured Caudovirales phage]
MFLSKLKAFVEKHRSKGRGEAFGFDDITTETYLKWAFSQDYLLLQTKNSEITAIAIVYPVKDTSSEDALCTFNYKIPRDKEHLYALCIMDMISLDTESTKNLVKDFKLRYPHWDRCKKWALRFGNLKEITNQYIDLL